MIFKTERIISILRLSKGFDSDVISFGNINEKSFMRYGILFLGLYLVADSFPNFLYYTYLWFKRQISANGLSENIGYILDYNWWTITGLSVLLGFIMITNSKKISKWLISN